MKSEFGTKFSSASSRHYTESPQTLDQGFSSRVVSRTGSEQSSRHCTAQGEREWDRSAKPESGSASGEWARAGKRERDECQPAMKPVARQPSRAEKRERQPEWEREGTANAQQPSRAVERRRELEPEAQRRKMVVREDSDDEDEECHLLQARLRYDRLFPVSPTQTSTPRHTIRRCDQERQTKEVAERERRERLKRLEQEDDDRRMREEEDERSREEWRREEDQREEARQRREDAFIVDYGADRLDEFDPYERIIYRNQVRAGKGHGMAVRDEEDDEAPEGLGFNNNTASLSQQQLMHMQLNMHKQSHHTMMTLAQTLDQVHSTRTSLAIIYHSPDRPALALSTVHAQWPAATALRHQQQLSPRHIAQAGPCTPWHHQG